MKVLVSACLLGERVRYHGGDAACAHPVLSRWLAEGRVVAFCPEVAGGLGVPRPAAELQGGVGEDVLDGAARVATKDGREVTSAFIAGAREALATAVAGGVRIAVLKEGSPSCGSGSVYDGSFSGARRPGRGVSAALLERNGIRVFSDAQLDEADRYLIDASGLPSDTV
jgi:uncharacterized protein YbbK (DUF523 family)